VARVESSWKAKAYRYEPVFWEMYMKDKPEWKDCDPKVVSASYGLMQLMFPTARETGYEGEAAGLYDPETNINLGAKYLRHLLDGVWAEGLPWKHDSLSAYDMTLAQYNGGRWRNPSAEGTLRNRSYVDKVWAAFKEIGC
jgi:soluble lytic murein transglycosylase-like protein